MQEKLKTNDNSNLIFSNKFCILLSKKGVITRTNIGCVKKAYGEKLYIGHYDIDLHKYEPQDKIKLCTINEIKLHKNYLKNNLKKNFFN